MSNPISNIVNMLSTPEEAGLDARLLVPLIRLLAAGDPVTIDQLATASGSTLNDVRAALATVPETEYDDQGRIVGQVLTLRPTPHRFTVAGEELYAWCALDTLVFPTLLEKTARIESVSPSSGDAIRLTVDAAGVTTLDPESAVVSLVNPEDMTSIRSSVCNQVHYFSSRADAAPWLADHTEAEVVSVAEAYRLGARLTGTVLAQPTSDVPDTSTAPACHC